MTNSVSIDGSRAEPAVGTRLELGFVLLVAFVLRVLHIHGQSFSMDEIEELSLPAEGGSLGIGHLLKAAGLVSSTSEAFRMIKQGAVKVDGNRVEDRGLEMQAGTTHIYQVGKRKFARVTLT